MGIIRAGDGPVAVKRTLDDELNAPKQAEIHGSIDLAKLSELKLPELKEELRNHPKRDLIDRNKSTRDSTLVPAAEDGSLLVAAVEVYKYDCSNSYNAHNCYTRDLLRIGAEQNFQVVVPSEDLQQVRETIVEDLICSDGLSKEEAAQIVETSLRQIHSGSREFAFPEDNKWPLAANGVSIPADVSEKTVDASYALLKKFPEDTKTTGSNISFRNDPFDKSTWTNIGFGVDQFGGYTPAIEGAEAKGLPSYQAKSYVEGGNMLSGRKADGTPYSIVGQDSVTISTLHLLETKQITAEDISQARSRGLPTESPTRSEALEMGKRLQKYGFAPRDCSDKELRKAAGDFVVAQELTREVIAKDLGLDNKQLIVVSQPGFHIDMEMLPLQPGQVLVHDPRLDSELISAALAKSTPGSAVHDELKQMLTVEQNKSSNPNTDKVIDTVIDQLKKAGLEPVRAPGVLEIPSYSKGGRINFINAMVGKVQDGDGCFYVGNSTRIEPLQQAFEQFLATQGVSQVYWAGGMRASGEKLDPSNAMLDSYAGLNCIEVRYPNPIDKID